jgi:hypothetical protein
VTANKPANEVRFKKFVLYEKNGFRITLSHIDFLLHCITSHTYSASVIRNDDCDVFVSFQWKVYDLGLFIDKLEFNWRKIAVWELVKKFSILKSSPAFESRTPGRDKETSKMLQREELRETLLNKDFRDSPAPSPIKMEIALLL